MKILTQHATVKRAYTKITEGEEENHRGTYQPCFNVWFVVNGQHFCVTPHACSTLEEAEEMQELLATALLVVVREQQEQPTKKGRKK